MYPFIASFNHYITWGDGIASQFPQPKVLHQITLIAFCVNFFKAVENGNILGGCGIGPKIRPLWL